MPKSKPELEYVSNNSFMTSQVKVPNPFGGDYEDPLAALKAKGKETVEPIPDPKTISENDSQIEAETSRELNNQREVSQSLDAQSKNIGRPNDENLGVKTPKR